MGSGVRDRGSETLYYSWRSWVQLLGETRVQRNECRYNDQQVTFLGMCRMDELNPYVAPQADLEEAPVEIDGNTAVVRDGKTLIVPEGARLPRRCVSCNRPGNHRLQVVIPEEPRPQRDYAWAIPLVLLGAVAILILGYIGVDVPVDRVPLPPAWIIFLLVPIVFAAITVHKWTTLDTADFYLCRTHHWVRSLGNLLSGGWLVVFFGLQVWIVSPYADDADLTDWLRFPYLLLWLGIAVACNHLRAWCHTSISGKPPHDDHVMFRGFGKKYLESFPTATDRSEHVG